MEETRNHPHDFDQFVGSAVVIGAFYGRRNTILQLETFAGAYIGYTVSGIPDHAGVGDFHGDTRPLSVKIQHGGERCWVIALTPDGPRRSKVTLGTALAIHQAGVHAVVDGGLPAEVPCSTDRQAKEYRPLSGPRQSVEPPAHS